ncbi:MAG: thiamine diphosphokinase [Elusimicrobia bacterium]|nr:thiamine diphosphokinase [Elusimicrobiota bacterium]
MKPRTALLLLNGELREPAPVRTLARRADVLVCADGGARHALGLRLIPDAVVGDMDSAPRSLPRSWRRVPFIRDLDVSRGDLDKSLDYLESLGVRRVWVAGALGGGLDHELVNLAALERRGGKLELAVVGGGLARLLGPGRHALDLRRGERFSLLAAPRARVTLTGALYGLREETLTRGSRGLGNRCAGRAALTVHTGLVWLAVDAR